ncbi:MAG: hypothetical protein ACR2QC_07830 [Gammaproteobacteria bacterium]
METNDSIWRAVFGTLGALVGMLAMLMRTIIMKPNGKSREQEMLRRDIDNIQSIVSEMRRDIDRLYTRREIEERIQREKQQ